VCMCVYCIGRAGIMVLDKITLVDAGITNFNLLGQV
jgi:hypothetical protein